MQDEFPHCDQTSTLWLKSGHLKNMIVVMPLGPRTRNACKVMKCTSSSREVPQGHHNGTEENVSLEE
ncbi:MAG: hypothetical protein HKP56_14585 [Anderseniella sp.]|nr:hypothetical protein [Anderseniella sp.]